MRPLTPAQVQALLAKVRNPFFNPLRKQQINDLATDMLAEFNSSEELESQYALFIALLNKMTL